MLYLVILTCIAPLLKVYYRVGRPSRPAGLTFMPALSLRPKQAEGLPTLLAFGYLLASFANFSITRLLRKTNSLRSLGSISRCESKESSYD